VRTGSIPARGGDLDSLLPLFYFRKDVFPFPESTILKEEKNSFLILRENVFRQGKNRRESFLRLGLMFKITLFELLQLSEELISRPRRRPPLGKLLG
jgi:hypothetical protein